MMTLDTGQLHYLTVLSLASMIRDWVISSEPLWIWPCFSNKLNPLMAYADIRISFYQK
jgi:hypothetical protein